MQAKDSPNLALAQAILIAIVFGAVIVGVWRGPEAPAKVFNAAEDEELGVESAPGYTLPDRPPPLGEG